MKKLLIITTIPSTIHAFLLPLAEQFRSQGWRVDAMACGISTYKECLESFDRVWDVEWSRNPLYPRNLLLAPRIIQQAIQEEQYDIVHVHTPVAAFVTRFALRNWQKQTRPKVIYTAHGFHFYQGGKAFKNAVFLGLEKLAGAWTDYLVVINREDEEAAKRYGLISSKRVRYMPGIGVDLQYYSSNTIFKSEVELVRQELGLAPTTPLLLSVAELIPRKRHKDILRAFACLQRPEVCLAFAGDGLLMPKLQQLASELGIQNQVRFLGFRRDIPTLIRASMCTMLVSEQEGLPRSVMESMSLGIPVIGTDIRGIRDLLAPDCGLLVKLGDIEGLANALAYLLDNHQKAQIMAERGLKRIADYDVRQIIKQHESLYTEAVQPESTMAVVSI